VIALNLFGLIPPIQLFDFDDWTIQPWYGSIKGLYAGIYLRLENFSGIPHWTQKNIYLAFSSTIKQLIPTPLVFLLLGYRPSDMRFTHPLWKLAIALVGATASFG